MKELPNPETYEQEYKYMPWGKLIAEVIDTVVKEAPQHGSILDLMCGTGYMLGEISRRRDDLWISGVDINKEFISAAKNSRSLHHAYVNLDCDNALYWKNDSKYNIVTCTAGLHHLSYESQTPFLKSIPDRMRPNGIFICADPMIDDFSSEKVRKIASAKLGYEYLLATVNAGAPDAIIKAALDVLHNDVMGFEYKTSVKKLEPMLREIFSDVKTTKTWPDKESEYGDYYFICRNSK